MTTRDRSSVAPTAAAAGGVAAMAACCTTHMLILAGVLGGIGGFAQGGIALGVGAVVAAVAWPAAITLRRRSSQSTACCPAASDDLNRSTTLTAGPGASSARSA